MGADVNTMAERHLDRDDRPRWVRFAEQQVLSGWRLVVREAEGRAWWTREGATQLVPIDRAREILAFGFAAPAPLINADVVEAVAVPAISTTSVKAKVPTKMPRVDVGPGGRDEAHANLAVALYTDHPPLSMKAIADRLDTYYARVRALLVARGVEIRPPNHEKVMEEPPPLAQVSDGAVSRLVVQFRRKTEPPRLGIDARVAELHHHPCEPSCRMIAEHLGVSRTAVYNAIERAGIPQHSRRHRPLGPLPEDA